MICLAGNLPALQIGHQQVVGYQTDWIERALFRAAEASGIRDCPILNHLSEAVLHYLEKRCSLKLCPLEDLYERMRGMLRKIGYPEIAEHLTPLAPPVTVSLIGPARQAGDGFELVFFQLLKEEIQLLQNSGAELIRFRDIDESVSLLREGQKDPAAPHQLKNDIISFLEGYHQETSSPDRKLHLTLES